MKKYIMNKCHDHIQSMCLCHMSFETFVQVGIRMALVFQVARPRNNANFLNSSIPVVVLGTGKE